MFILIIWHTLKRNYLKVYFLSFLFNFAGNHKNNNLKLIKKQFLEYLINVWVESDCWIRICWIYIYVFWNLQICKAFVDVSCDLLRHCRKDNVYFILKLLQSPQFYISNINTLQNFNLALRKQFEILGISNLVTLLVVFSTIFEQYSSPYLIAESVRAF